MANKMKEFLPEIEMEKMQRLYEIEEKYEMGKISLEEAHRFMAEHVGPIRPYHIAYMEQNLKSGDDDECIRVNMRKVLELIHGQLSSGTPGRASDCSLL